MTSLLAAVILSWAAPATVLTQGQAANPIDPCAFISAADVEALTGEKVRGRPRDLHRTLSGLESYRCRYPGDNFTVVVSLETGRTPDDLTLYLKMLGAVVSRETSSSLKPVSGIGDRAWWGAVNPTNGILHIVRGTDVMAVQTYGKGPGAGTLEKTRAIADKVFATYQKIRK